MAFGRKGREEERVGKGKREKKGEERGRKNREEGRRERKQRDRLVTGERAAAEAKKERKATRTERRRRDDGERRPVGPVGATVDPLSSPRTLQRSREPVRTLRGSHRSSPVAPTGNRMKIPRE